MSLTTHDLSEAGAGGVGIVVSDIAALIHASLKDLNIVDSVFIWAHNIDNKAHILTFTIGSIDSIDITVSPFSGRVPVLMGRRIHGTGSEETSILAHADLKDMVILDGEVERKHGNAKREWR